MIAGVCYCLNEADVIGHSIEHHLAEGLGRIYVAHGPSTDGTADILASFGRDVRVVPYQHVHYDQAFWTTKMASLAAADGAAWIVPFDADEFWTAPGGLAPYLADLSVWIGAARAEWRQHRDWKTTFDTDEQQLPKTAFRWSPSVRAGLGNHIPEDVYGATLVSAVVAHHLMFRSFEQFAAKIKQRCARLPTEAREAGHEWHITRYDGLTTSELAEAWSAYRNRAHHFDPIPVRRRDDSPLPTD